MQCHYLQLIPKRSVDSSCQKGIFSNKICSHTFFNNQIFKELLYFQEKSHWWANTVTSSFISKLNEGSILKVNVLRRQNRTASWLLSTNGLIQIVMSLVGLANGKPRRCYYTCDHMIFMKLVISLNNMTVM